MTTSATTSASTAVTRGQPSLAPMPNATTNAAGRAPAHRMKCPNSSPLAAVAMNMTVAAPSGARRAQAAGRVIATTARQAPAPGRRGAQVEGGTEGGGDRNSAQQRGEYGLDEAGSGQAPVTSRAGNPASRHGPAPFWCVHYRYYWAWRSTGRDRSVRRRFRRSRYRTRRRPPPHDHPDGGHAEHHAPDEAEPHAGQALSRGRPVRGVDAHERGVGEPGHQEHEGAGGAEGRRDGCAVPGPDGQAAASGREHHGERGGDRAAGHEDDQLHDVVADRPRQRRHRVRRVDPVTVRETPGLHDDDGEGRHDDGRRGPAGFTDDPPGDDGEEESGDGGHDMSSWTVTGARATRVPHVRR